MLRVIAFFILLTSALLAPLWLFVLSAAVYIAYFGPVEPVIIAVLVDAQFGDPAQSFSYMYTVITAAFVLLLSTIRPLLRI